VSEKKKTQLLAMGGKEALKIKRIYSCGVKQFARLIPQHFNFSRKMIF
jgi:hypothetical protein